jgi:hypothetical protein
VTRAVLQIAAWCAAFWLALWLHARRTRDPRERMRFAWALGVGALLARAGHAVLWGEAGRIAEPSAAFSVLFFPLGVLWLAPHAAAFASLPLALATARLGCIAAGCCRGAAGEPLPFFEATAWVAVHLVLARGDPTRIPERFAFAFGGLRLAEAPWRPPVGAAVVTPELVALLWIAVGAWLRVRRQRESVTNMKRFPHASPTPGGAS